MKRTFKEGDIVAKIPSKEVYGAMLEYAKSKGVPCYPRTVADSFTEYPCLGFSPSERLCGFGGSNGHNIITHEQFYEFCDNWAELQPKRLQLNSEYSAEINHSTSTVKVGCQSFTFDKITELYNAMMTFKIIRYNNVGGFYEDIF